MLAPKDISWATKKHYLHHSNPSRPLCATLFDKCVLRPRKNAAWKVLKGEADGDKIIAKQTIQFLDNDNANMLSGRIVQDCVNQHLLDGHSFDAVVRYGMALFDEYEPRGWDDGKDERKLSVNRDEYDLVIKNAVDGIREAHSLAGINQITGETEILTQLDGLDLPYSGFPDFSRRIELKTKWSGVAANTKSGKRSAALPSQPDWSHICQVAGYWAGTGLMQTIVYATAKDYRIFNADNCERLTEQGLQSALKHIIAKCAIRENLLKSTGSVEDMLRLVEPDFKHMWAWDMKPSLVDEAKTLWGFK